MVLPLRIRLGPHPSNVDSLFACVDPPDPHWSRGEGRRSAICAATLERQGQIPTAQMTTDMDGVRAQIEHSRTFITTKREEQEVVRRQFDADIQRFRRLAAEP